MSDPETAIRRTQFRAIEPGPDHGEVDTAARPAEVTSHEALEQVWARRARELAQVVKQEEQGEHVVLLSFALGHEIYAVEAQYVSAIRPVQRITLVPRVPDWVAGVVNLRGHIVSVLHLQRFLGLASSGRNTGTFLVAAETQDMEIALLVDDVLSVEATPVSRIQDPAGTIRGIRPEYVRGVTTRPNGSEQSMWVILNLAAILGDKQLIVHEELG